MRLQGLLGAVIEYLDPRAGFQAKAAAAEVIIREERTATEALDRVVFAIMEQGRTKAERLSRRNGN